MRKFVLATVILVVFVNISLGQPTSIDSLFFTKNVIKKEWFDNVKWDSSFLVSKTMIRDSLKGGVINKDSILTALLGLLVNDYRKNVWVVKRQVGSKIPPKQTLISAFFGFIQKWGVVFLSFVGFVWLLLFPLRWFLSTRYFKKQFNVLIGGKNNNPIYLDELTRIVNQVKETTQSHFNLTQKLEATVNRIEENVIVGKGRNEDKEKPQVIPTNDGTIIKYSKIPQKGIFNPNVVKSGRLLTFEIEGNTGRFFISSDNISAAQKKPETWFSLEFCDIDEGDLYVIGKVEVNNIKITPGVAKLEEGKWKLSEKMKCELKK